MKKLIPVSLLLITILACNPNRVYEEHLDPSGHLEWNNNEVLKYTVNIEDIAAKYNVTLALRYAHGFMYTSLPVEITMTGPDDNQVVTEHIFHVRNEDGSFNGDGSGDIWDLEEMYLESIQFPLKGAYTFEIKQTSNKEKMHMVMEVGIIIDKIVTQQ